nr:hypothetical protein Iba_contig4944CG0010 [Ipomoea batatas]
MLLPDQMIPDLSSSPAAALGATIRDLIADIHDSTFESIRMSSSGWPATIEPSPNNYWGMRHSNVMNSNLRTAESLAGFRTALSSRTI